MEQVLQEAVTRVIASQPVAIPLLERFGSVALLDSSIVTSPEVRSRVWSGAGNRTGQSMAVLKIQVRLDLCTGALAGPFLQDGRCHCRASPFQKDPLRPGSLRLADLGCFSLAAPVELKSEDGG